jgi:hypothetical protein
MLELVQKSTKIPVKILGTISDLQNKYVVALMTEKNRMVCVDKTLIQKSKKYKNLSQKFYSDMDIFIHDNISLVDERIIFMNKRKFEDESYMRMRFELSRYLQDHKSERMKLMEIIYDENRDIQKKRNRLQEVLLPIFAKIVKVKSGKTEVGYNKLDYNFYEVPNHRIPCGLRSVIHKSGSNSSNSKSRSNQEEIIFDCSEDPHCMGVNNECKLFINDYNLLDTKKRNLDIYIPMMMEELIRFTLKRNEIIKDHIPSIINRERVVENPNKYYIINTMDPLGIIKKVESIFLDKEGLYIDKRPLFDMISTHDVVLPQNKYTLTNMTKLLSNMNQMPEMWSKLLGNHFILIAPHHGSKTLFSNLDLLIRELKNRNNANNMEEMDMRRLKEKMIEFMESPKNLQLFKKMEQKISSTPTNQGENVNVSGSKSQLHREYILQMYKNMEPKVFRNIHDFTSLKHKILHEDYEGNDIDLFILSHIFKTNIIVLSKIKREFISYGNESTDYYTDFLLMLRNNNIDMFKYQWFQRKNKGFIHKEKDYPELFVREVLEKL